MVHGAGFKAIISGGLELQPRLLFPLPKARAVRGVFTPRPGGVCA